MSPHDGGRGGGAAGTLAVEHQAAGVRRFDHDGVVGPVDTRERVLARDERRVDARGDALAAFASTIRSQIDSSLIVQSSDLAASRSSEVIFEMPSRYTSPAVTRVWTRSKRESRPSTPRRSPRRRPSDRPRRSPGDRPRRGCRRSRRGLFHRGEDEVGVPLTMPRTRSTRSPASDCVSGRITGIAPATAASKYRSTLCRSAASASYRCTRRAEPCRGHDGLARVERGEHQLRGKLDTADHLDDHVDVVAGDQRLGVGGEQFLRQAAIAVDAPDRDSAQLQTCADSGFEVGRVLADDPSTSLPTVPSRETATRWRAAPIRWSLRNSKLSRSSTVSLRKIRREAPSRTATTGAGEQVVRLDIE